MKLKREAESFNETRLTIIRSVDRYSDYILDEDLDNIVGLLNQLQSLYDQVSTQSDLKGKSHESAFARSDKPYQSVLDNYDERNDWP